MSDINFEQQCAISFCFRLGHSTTGTFANFSRPTGTVFCQGRRFFGGLRNFQKKGKLIEDEPRSGRPSSSRTNENVDIIQYLVRSDRRLTIRMIGLELNLIHTTAHQILTNELEMREICVKIAPKNLLQDQKNIRREKYLNFLESIENDPYLLECVIIY
ncbi:hypothetical protein J437_LFUL008791 [Ladona fulva]|uniref:Uncharacterized protein n=1 Tax=Ladona fulva TaxID=123851 RepID=A0A8K0K8I4_LADFU|nr:hypothetical protein J437_LFUL008791 [Ladona fulva]